MLRDHRSWLLVLLAVAAGCSAAEADLTSRGAGVSVDGLARGYAELRRMTPEPVEVDARIATLCVAPTRIESDQVERGVSARTAIDVYMNETAARAWERKTAVYPVGAAIMKAKQPARSNAAPSSDSEHPDGLGGMVKRSAGFDPEHGDWEYFYVEPKERVTTGRLTNCIECHDVAEGKDYVFGTWAQDR